MSYAYTWTQPVVMAPSGSQFMGAHMPSSVLHPNQHYQGAIPVSSYSSLAGALDPASVTTRSRPCMRTSASPPYAYPASHHDPPPIHGRSRSNSQVLYQDRSVTASRSRMTQDKHCREVPFQAVHISRAPRMPKSIGPTNHVLVPQKEFREPEMVARSYMDPNFRHPPIGFQSANIPELGVRVGKIAEKYVPSVVGGNDPVLSQTGGKEIKVWILWPGYGSEPVQKRVKTHNGTITRDIVLMIIANHLLDFVSMIQKGCIPIERGYEDWIIGPRTDHKQGITGQQLFITRLIHRGGSNWQPEIWAPRRS